jgi:hypothetical protein
MTPTPPRPSGVAIAAIVANPDVLDFSEELGTANAVSKESTMTLNI